MADEKKTLNNTEDAPPTGGNISEFLNLNLNLRPDFLRNMQKDHQFLNERMRRGDSDSKSRWQSWRKKNTPLVLGSLAALIVLVLALTWAGEKYLLFSRWKETLVSESAITFKQVSEAVVGGQPVRWVAMVKKSDIREGQRYIVIPKNATRVSISQIDTQKALALSNAPILSSGLALRDRLALYSGALADNGSQSPDSSVALSIPRVLFDIEASLDVPAPEQTVQQVDISSLIEEPAPVESAEASPSVEEEASEPAQSAEAPAENEEAGEQPPIEDEPPVLEESPGQEVQDVENRDESEEAEESEPEPESESGDQQEISGSQEDQTQSEAEIEEEVILVEYETPAPVIEEEEISHGKIVTVSTEAESEEPETPVQDVLAFTAIPEIYKVGQEHRIRITWESEDGREMPFTAYDLNENGKLDYLEWTVPHLSEQVFEIIFITKASEFDENDDFVNDIYETVSLKDENYAAVESSHYVRTTFNKPLTQSNDITVFGRAAHLNSPSAIEVYPVYDGQATEYPLALISDGTTPTFDNIGTDGKYRVLLGNLQAPTDTFDLKILNANIDIDYITDPISNIGGTV